MKTHGTRFFKNVCWLLLVAICVFHVWSDGRNGTLMQELLRQGQSPVSAREEIYWLCAPLNIAALSVLILIITLSIKWKWN
jgi:hypothetical protein